MARDLVGRARRAGDLPRAPGWTAAAVVAGGVAGATLGGLAAPWSELLAAAWAEPEPARVLALRTAGVTAGGAAIGALLGLALAQLLLGAWAPGLRARWRASRPPSRTGLGALAVTAVALPFIPELLAYVSAGDPGAALLWAVPVTLAVATMLALPLLLWSRGRALARWRERVEPDPPPRRDDDLAAPEAIDAIRCRQEGA